MAQRSRKRGRRGQAGAPKVPAARGSGRAGGREAAAGRAGGRDTAAGEAGSQAPGPGRARAGSSAPSPPRPYARAEARNQAVRATLTPYAPGERPWAIVVCAVLAAGFGAFNLVSFLIGAKLKVDGQKPGTAGVILFAVVMFVCAGGMWQMRYWAVLGFQVLLLLVLLTFAILLIKVSNLAGLAVCVIGLSVGGLLFYKLVRAMSRMQVPTRGR